MKPVHVMSCAGLDKATTGYSYLVMTDTSHRMNLLYGIDSSMVDVLTRNCPLNVLVGKVRAPMTAKTDHNFRIAKLFLIDSFETNKVIGHFADIMHRLGQFVALPYDEVASAAGISQSYVDQAVNGPFFQTFDYSHINGNPMRFMEFTEHFCPLPPSMRPNLESTVRAQTFELR